MTAMIIQLRPKLAKLRGRRSSALLSVVTLPSWDVCLTLIIEPKCPGEARAGSQEPGSIRTRN
jgi:hypothetical protein